MACMSLFYPMKKYAAYVPALVRVEEFYYLKHRTKEEATEAFLDHVDFKDKDMLLWVYKCGQTFQDWNFQNLFDYADPEEIERHRREAQEFLNLDWHGF